MVASVCLFCTGSPRLIWLVLGCVSRQVGTLGVVVSVVRLVGCFSLLNLVDMGLVWSAWGLGVFAEVGFGLVLRGLGSHL